MDKDSHYFLKISGYINSGKHREFEQTMRFISNHLPAACLGHNLGLDVYNQNLYHFFLLWRNENGFLSFKSSHEFELLKGTFQTLGEYQNTIAGRLEELQFFELNQLDA